MASNGPIRPAIDVNRALTDVNQFLASQGQATTPQTSSGANVSGIKLAPLPSGEFGEPAKVVPLNRTVRLPPSADTQSAAPTSNGTDYLQPNAATNNLLGVNGYGGLAGQSATFQPANNYGSPSFGQFFGNQSYQPYGTNQFVNNSALLAAPHGILTSSGNNTGEQPNKEGEQKKVRFLIDGVEKDNGASEEPLQTTQNDSESLNVSILKSKKMLDLPRAPSKPIVPEDDDSDIDDDNDWEDLSQYEDDDDDLDSFPIIADDEMSNEDEAEAEKRHRDAAEPKSLMSELMGEEAAAVAAGPAESTSLTDELFSNSLFDTNFQTSGGSGSFARSLQNDRRQNSLTTNANQPSFADPPAHHSTSYDSLARSFPNNGFRGQDQSRQGALETAAQNRATQEQAKNRSMFKKGMDFMKGIDPVTGAVDHKAKKIRIAIAIVIVLVIMASVGAILYYKYFLPRQGKKTKRENRMQVADEAPKQHITTTSPEKNTPVQNSPTPQRETGTVQNTTTAANQTKSTKPIVDFDDLAQQVQASLQSPDRSPMALNIPNETTRTPLEMPPETFEQIPSETELEDNMILY